jgi:hypothetical protein
MTYEQYENHLADLLRFEGCEASPLPTVEALNAPRPTGAPQLFVILNGGAYGEPEELGLTAQLERLRCEVFIKARARGGALGVFDLADRAANTLMGRRLPDAKGRVTLDEFSYVAGFSGAWMYKVGFTFARYRVEALHGGEEEGEGAIRKITAKLGLP